MKHFILASTSTVYGGKSLDYLMEALSELYKNTDEILFIPYARPGGISHDTYAQKIKTVFLSLDKKIKSIHEYENPREAIANAQGIYVGGGNTFVLVKQLYRYSCMDALKDAVNRGTPYLGSSAGSNICGLTMQTTNDMPIVYPPSFKTLGLVPFNINPHYLDPSPSSHHMGETRETRIQEFHKYNTPPVIGLREGSWILATEDKLLLQGTQKARIFEYNRDPYEIESGQDLNALN